MKQFNVVSLVGSQVCLNKVSLTKSANSQVVYSNISCRGYTGAAWRAALSIPSAPGVENFLDLIFRETTSSQALPLGGDVPVWMRATDGASW